MVYRTYISIFSLIGFVDQSKACTLIYLQNLHKFATTNGNFKKSIISVMLHRKAYMYINFQQNRVYRSTKPSTQIFLQNNVSYINLQLAIRILKITPFRHALPHNQYSGQFWDQATY